MEQFTYYRRTARQHNCSCFSGISQLRININKALHKRILGSELVVKHEFIEPHGTLVQLGKKGVRSSSETLLPREKDALFTTKRLLPPTPFLQGRPLLCPFETVVEVHITPKSYMSTLGSNVSNL